MPELFSRFNDIDNINSFKHICFCLKLNEYVCITENEDLDNLIKLDEYKYLQARLLNQPIKPFADIDIDTNKLDDILTHLDSNDAKAEYIKQKIIDVFETQLYMLDVDEEYMNYEIATDHRSDKYSYAVYFTNCSFESLTHLKEFWKAVADELPSEVKQFFDRPSSNFRLVGCYKDNHVRRWQDKSETNSVVDSVPNFIRRVNYEINYTPKYDTSKNYEVEGDMQKVVEIASNNEYINDNFIMQDNISNNTIQYKRRKPAHCDICNRTHDNAGIYVMLMGETVYMGCHRNKTSKYVKIGSISTSIDKTGLIEEFQRVEKQQTTTILPKPTEEKKRKLQYYNDASYLIGSNWDANYIEAWIKRCIFKIVVNDSARWITKDYDHLTNTEVIKTQSEPPFSCKSNRKTIQVDSKDYNLCDYIIDYCNKPDNFYTSSVNYPYLRQTDNKYANSKYTFNTWSGFLFKYKEVKQNIIKPSFKHWVDHFNYICNNDNTFIKWLAHGIQKPFEKCFNVQMLGKKGTGKSIIFSCIQRIYGDKTTLQVSDLNAVTGNFNSALEGMQIVNLNECTNFTKQREKNIFKSLTTETNLRINEKFMPAYNTQFYGRFFITTNERFGIEITPDDRRNYCVETPSTHKNDKSYFARMVEDLNSADDTPFRDLFIYLSNLDISDFEPTKPPMTKLKLEMIKTSTNPLYHYLTELATGERNENIIFTHEEKSNNYIYQHNSLYEDYKKYMTDEGEPTQLIKRKKQFDTMLQELGLEYKRYRIGETRIRGYKFTLDYLKDRLNSYMKDD